MTTDGNAALAVVERDDGLRMVVSPAEALKRVQELQAFVAKVMVSGTDYGVIPGTGGKPTLFQPGAQKLCELYGFAQDFQDEKVVEDWERPLFVYRKRCILTRRSDGRFIGSGIGSCNSREDRYAWRWVKKDQMPQGVDLSTYKTKVNKWKDTLYRLPNDDIYSLVNTIEKMACKRALIMATIGSTRSAGLFTQDLEDLPPDAFGEVSDSRSWEKGKEPAEVDPELAGKFAERIRSAKAVKELKAIGKEIGDAHRKGRITTEDRTGLLKTYTAAVTALSPKKAPAPEESGGIPDAEVEEEPSGERQPGED